EVDELDPSIKDRTAMAMKRIRKNQRYNKERYDKRRTNETFKRGDFVLWRQEPRTNMALDEHAKLISPWYGPVTIFKDIGQNKYIIIDDDTNPKTINVENLKKYQKRPDWMKDEVPEEMEVEGNIIVSPSVEDKGDDIPAIVPIFQADRRPTRAYGSRITYKCQKKLKREEICAKERRFSRYQIQVERRRQRILVVWRSNESGHG
ncbi:MAG TPA: hypothetical protein VER35_01040, partial [Candidatus Limnocylindrales bacterium]|nr:hypothetical protein [Candidatus Limnocylindrales bacterium]